MPVPSDAPSTASISSSNRKTEALSVVTNGDAPSEAPRTSVVIPTSNLASATGSHEIIADDTGKFTVDVLENDSVMSEGWDIKMWISFIEKGELSIKSIYFNTHNITFIFYKAFQVIIKMDDKKLKWE